MSEPVSQRRQPPSPLVFTPETVLPPVVAPSNSSSSAHGSGSNTVSMPFVRRHVTRRLKAAKLECDKELQRVTNSITAFFEERLREGELERELEREQRDRDRDRERDRDGQSPDPDALRDAFVLQQADLRSAIQSDDASSDGGYEAELEGNHHSRHRASLEEPRRIPNTLTHSSSSPGLLAASISSSSPAPIRRQATISWDKAAGTSAGATGTSQGPETATSPRKQAIPVPPSWSSGGVASRRLSRSIHIPIRPTRSGHSSRSTSRSRSPLPPTTHSSFFESLSNIGPPSAGRRSSRILIDDPVDPIMTNLYELIAVATDVTEMSVTHLTAQPKICEAVVQRVQHIGKAWDDHPDWHGRNWYVQVLLAVAGLSRVLEWWEAEKQFWNFDDNDEEQDEALTFVMKPADEELPPPAPTPRLPPDEEVRLRLSRPTSQGKRPRDEMQSMSLAPLESSRASSSKTLDTGESARVLATERLRLQAETAQNRNIVLELNLDGDHLLWVNYAWFVVVGTDPEELQGTRISRLLSPQDVTVFQEATKRLQDDDSHTVEVRFRLRVEPEDDRDSSAGPLFQLMEGKGMLMIDREECTLSHTMWVIKPSGPPEYLQPSILVEEEDGLVNQPSVTEMPDQSFDARTEEPPTPLPFPRPINLTAILCRICENNIPQWYFEKHNETCSEEHRLEAEIGECNESIAELRTTIRDLFTAMDRSSPVTEYRGLPIMSPSSSPSSSSPLQLFRINKMQRFGVKKMQRRLLEQLEDTLQVALEVSIPSLKDEESKEPIERQRLLSPGSERKMTQIRNWQKPATTDSGLGQLVQDAERVMRQKIDTVVRLQNTIRYSEKVRQEWEERVEKELAQIDDEEDAEEEEAARLEEEEAAAERDEAERNAEDRQIDDDHSSTTSEYAFSGNVPSSDPTPMASSSPIPPASTDSSPGIPSAPPPPPLPYAWQGISLQTRSSTPSSVSSPLALAAPIIASSSPDDNPPFMDLNDSSSRTVRTRKSIQTLEPTPPLSPLNSPLELPISRRSHRRHSTINPIISPVTNAGSPGPTSPRLPSATPLSRTAPTSIKDFEIIKPISKGAFGSVFLAKKKATGDYFAIKVLKKADMIAKNQITNVKAERMILMKQAESPFVAKLFFTFQSKENLYLVMEYLNGGDCAALIKSLGALPEEWTKNYIAEVVLGLQYLHERGIIHRDLKPDNLLIDQHGHLKLTDFGLSRIGLLGRQTRENQLVSTERGARTRTRYSPHSRPPSMDSAYLSSPLIPADLVGGGSYFNQQPTPVYRPGTNSFLSSTDDISESSGSDSLPNFFARRSGPHMNDSPLQSFASELTNDLRSHSSPGSGTPPGEQKFVGTPDYLAPETILGLRGDDAAVDWWALGVITYEFLYGAPPFHDETPEKVFENILSGHIEWMDEYVDYSREARDFMERLLTLDPTRRLGVNGAEEVKAHPFFAGIEWDKVTTTEAAFIPQVTDPESTDYFDPRGAILQLFDDEAPTIAQPHPEHPHVGLEIPHSASVPVPSRDAVTPADDDFGTFSFKNLPVLKQANDDMIRKLRTDQMAPITHTLSESNAHSRKRSLSARKKAPSSVVTSFDSKSTTTNPPSPATSTSSIASSPSRGSLPPSTPGSVASHIRKPSEYGAVERFKQNFMDADVSRRNSMPSRLRTASVSSSMGEGSLSDAWPPSVAHNSGHFEVSTPPSSVASIDLKRGPDPSDRAVTCLLAEDNPITAKIIETLLIRLGCRCVVVADGSEAIGVAMGDIKFDCILMDLHMPVVDGESAARYIKSTNNRNTSTPIIAVSAYSGADNDDASALFAASLSKPLQKADLLAAMRQLGFKTSTAAEAAHGTAKTISVR
ncbi:hypothetical protein BV25DRAFT_1791490 [Artomyces pyxidatus]|uniref:Uncharacterized protein n=1 Tax=Artomyces pyxidatus TaxID=48021 RepID=A0ACB8TK79_9AGAM|nr:hypothetical protein BV25DRAFT_1791490 [Artomyces pyxidatus]